MDKNIYLAVEHKRGNSFTVRNVSRDKTLELVEVPSPYAVKVEGAGDGSLMLQLHWYLETFLDYPFPPRTQQAEAVQKALRCWGQAAFKALFDNRDVGKWMSEGELNIKISSDDPQVLSWPWEAVEDPQHGVLAHRARIERKVNKDLPDPQELSDQLPDDRINILLVTARPYENDVNYRSISRKLVEVVKEKGLSASVDILRPPTFDQLRKHLKERPGYYHILHFDGHGGYGNVNGGNDRFQGNQGCLIFETKDGKPDLITAHDLTVLLKETAVPVVVLNACQSAMIDGEADHPYASVAAGLLKAGIHGVVAMAYSLYVTGAQEFLPPFYEALFDSGSLTEAVRCGRLEMFRHSSRSSINPNIKLSDWLVPVVYQQEAFDFSFAKRGAAIDEETGQALPEEVLEKDDYAFVGRDGDLLKLERALRRKPAGILIQGMGGIGKTTLAKAAVRWLEETDGLGRGCFWFVFNDIRSADYVLNQIGRAIFEDVQFDSRKHGSQLIQALQKNRFLIVWDNFESVRGIEENGLLDGDAQEQLKTFLQSLRGGATKVLITSRGNEEWLGGGQHCFPIPLGGLLREDVWEYAAEILDDFGLVVDRDDEKLGTLLGLLEGHPLLIRIVLLEAGKNGVSNTLRGLMENMEQFVGQADTEAHQRMLGTFSLLLDKFPTVQQNLLIPLSLHQKNIEGRYLEEMAILVADAPPPSEIAGLLVALVPAGLLRDLGGATYQIHPLLSSCLWQRMQPLVETEPYLDWCRAFVAVIASLADHLAPMELHEQRNPFALHGANFRVALSHAEAFGMDVYQSALVQGLASFAKQSRNFPEAAQLFRRLVEILEREGDGLQATEPYHQLGIVAEEQHDFPQAQDWYLKSLAIEDKQGNEHQMAISYHQLGMVAHKQLEYPLAEKWYRKSLATFERLGIKDEAAVLYYAMGMFAADQGDFLYAEGWYRKALAIFERLGQEEKVAGTYHQLGIVAADQGDFLHAEGWYSKALVIKEKQGDEHGAALTYHQLGMLAEDQGDFLHAQAWYLKALVIKEKQGDEHGAAGTYHQLGIVAQQQDNFLQAQGWFLKSLAIIEKAGNEDVVAGTYYQLGMVAHKQLEYPQAQKWYRKSLAVYEKQGDKHGAAGTYYQLGMVSQQQHNFPQAQGWFLKSLAFSEKAGKEDAVAETYYQLGMVAKKQDNFPQAQDWVLKSLAVFEKQGNTFGAAMSSLLLGIVESLQKNFTASACWLVKGAVGFTKMNDEKYVQIVVHIFISCHKQARNADKGAIRKTWEDAGLPDLDFDEQGIEEEALPVSFAPELKVGDSEGVCAEVKPIRERQESKHVFLMDEALEEEKNLFTVWYGTNRAPVLADGILVDYSGEREPDGNVYFGSCDVLIPKSHKFGSVGSRWWKRWLKREDDRLKMESLRGVEENHYWQELQTLLVSIPEEERRSVIFIHGYNVSFEESAIRAAQIGFDLKIPGAMAFFSWPSKGTLKGYPADEATIQGSEDSIAQFLESFARRSGSDKVHIIAHSMGNRGLLRAVQRIVSKAEKRSDFKFAQIILAAPDVDVDLFMDLATNYPNVSERTTLYVSAKDKAVALSEAMHDYDRVGFAPPVTVVPGIDTVEVTNVDLSLLGHGYVAEAEAVLYDMDELLRKNTPPKDRTRVQSAQTPQGMCYWVIRA